MSYILYPLLGFTIVPMSWFFYGLQSYSGTQLPKALRRALLNMYPYELAPFYIKSEIYVFKMRAAKERLDNYILNALDRLDAGNQTDAKFELGAKAGEEQKQQFKTGKEKIIEVITSYFRQ